VGRRAQIAIVAALVGLAVLVGGAYAWDRAESDQIAKGVTVGGVDVGGMSADAAAKKLNNRLVKPLDGPVTVTFQGTKYTLGPDRLQLHADVHGMADAALEASRSDNLPSRVWRYATGGEVDHNIHPEIAYSKGAVASFVQTVAKEIDTPAQDATVEPSPASLNAVPGHDGLQLDTGGLQNQITEAIQSPHDRTVKPKVQRTKPQVTTDQLAAQYPVYLTIDRGNFQIRLWQDLKLAKTYTIAVGQQGLETPAGTYSIDDKQVNPSWHVPDSAWAGDLAGRVIPPGPQDPIKARWMGFYNGAGIHGTDEISSLGTAASHGCVRMSIPDVEELYDQVPLGTPIYIGN
jgi:lipoprotein-anchoring transpeptidase ErfK/SrfK